MLDSFGTVTKSYMRSAVKDTGWQISRGKWKHMSIIQLDIRVQMYSSELLKRKGHYVI